jgi:ABC-2 type transport system permease protein
MIDGFRYGFFARADSSPWLALFVGLGCFAVAAAFALAMLRRGYKLRN